ncbi:MAG: hypothetical protein DWQ04_00555 [Chloroflexi bacterium]|nr:MAG: hypothetical protein DWQ04_00555 [Chloroflexota bacterium]
MNDVILPIICFAIPIGGLIAIIALLARRRKSTGKGIAELPELGPKGRGLLWIIRVLVVLMVLSLIGLYVFSSLFYLYAAAGCLVIYFVIGRIYQIARLAGK